MQAAERNLEEESKQVFSDAKQNKGELWVAVVSRRKKQQPEEKKEKENGGNKINGDRASASITTQGIPIASFLYSTFHMNYYTVPSGFHQFRKVRIAF